MSLAGPYGEAACKYCGTLQDLREDGALVLHSVPPSILGPRTCPGSRQMMEDMPKELPALAFSSQPVFVRCPGCKTEVQVSTVGFSRPGWRFTDHGGCRYSGWTLGSAAQETGVEI